MFEFDVRKSFTSDEKLICFLSDAANLEFRQALREIMEPHGFVCNFDEYHISIENLSGNKRLRQLVIQSDPWFVWGDSRTYGKNIALNKELISCKRSYWKVGYSNCEAQPNNALNVAHFVRWTVKSCAFFCPLA